VHQFHVLSLNLLLAILLAAVGSYLSLITRKQQAWGLQGVVFGLCVVLVMSAPLVVGQGWIMDLRSVLMSIAGYAGGATTVLVAGVFGICYQFWIGGAGATSGALSIVVYGLLGVVLKHYASPKKLANPLVSVPLGLVLAGVNLAFLAGGAVSNAERFYMKQEAAPLALLLTPFATVVSYWLFYFLYRGIKRYAALNTAFQVAPTQALVLTQAGDIALSTSGLASHPELKSELVSYLQGSLAVRHESSKVLTQESSIHLAGGQVDYLLSVDSAILPSGERGSVAILEDITELKQAFTQHDRFFELSPDALVVLGADGLIRRTNKSFEAMLGYERATLTGLPITAVIHPDDLQPTLDAWRAGSESSILLENRLIASDGSVRWLAWSGVPVALEQVIYAVGRDITEQSLGKRVLEEQAAQLRNQLELLELAHDSIIIRQLDNTITFWNRGAEQNYGWTKQEALGGNYYQLLRSEYGTYPEDIENELFLRDYWHGEASRLTRDRSRIIVSCQWVLQRDQSGWPVAILEVSQDITQRQQAAESLAQLASIVEQSGDGIVSIGFNERVLTWNRGAEQLLGYSSVDICNTLFTRLIPSHGLKTWHTMLDKLRQGVVVDPIETAMLHQDGSAVPTLISFSSLRNLLGQPSALSLVIRDNARKVQLDKEMARLDRLNLAGQLAAGIGHEVRNPMTTVRGFLQLFTKKPELEKYVEQFNLVISELDRANEIITEFLTLACNRPVELSPVQLNDSIESLLPLLKADAIISRKEIKLELQPLPILFLNEKEIRQLLFNLVRNGLEAMTEGGTLTISTQRCKQTVVLAIKDQGQGIPPDVAAKIGTPFFTTKQNGTGLGLAVCYTIAEQHRANITFETSAKGTTFFVTFAAQ